jgi:hypothetical protein
MPNPTTSAVHVDRPLTNISVAYARSIGFVGRSVFPTVPVTNKSDVFFKYDKGDWLREEAEVRAPGTESAGGGFNITEGNYSAKVYAFHKDLDDQTIANADSPLNLRQDATRYATRKVVMQSERDWAASFFTAGVWGTNKAGVAATPTGDQFLQWDQSGADPIGNVTGVGLDIEAGTGYLPNVGVAQARVLRGIKENADVIDRIKYTQTGIVTMDLIAAAFDLDAIIKASAVSNTANEGATASVDYMLDKGFLLAYRAPSASLAEPSGGYSFVWTGMAGSVEGMQTKAFRVEILESDRIEVQGAWAQKLVAADVGAFFASAVA